MSLTREQLETALDGGNLEVQWRNGKWHSARRNGRTKTWKRDPDRFLLPCKTGYKDCFVVGYYESDVYEHRSGGHTLTSPYLRIKQ